MAISSTTLYALTKAGWFEGRNIDISSTVELLKEKGYQITPAFIEFYSEFGKLKFPLQVAGFDRGFAFVAEDGFSIEGDGEIIEYYPKGLGCETLTLVGHINGMSAIAINEAGMLYSLHRGFTSKLGIGVDAIEKLVNAPWSQFESEFTLDD